MAFQKSIELHDFGITLTESYHRLQSVKIESGVLEYTIAVYPSKELRTKNPGSPIFKTTNRAPYELVLAAEGDELFAKTYNFIKANDDQYKVDATDV